MRIGNEKLLEIRKSEANTKNSEACDIHELIGDVDHDVADKKTGKCGSVSDMAIKKTRKFWMCNTDQRLEIKEMLKNADQKIKHEVIGRKTCIVMRVSPRG